MADTPPLLAILGRRGRWAVVQALRATPDPTSVRAIADRAGVHPVVGGRAVAELTALGAVESFRPGRALHVAWRPESRVARVIEALDVPDVHGEAARIFADAYPRRATILRYTLDGDDVQSPLRLALIGADTDALMEAADGALDAVWEAGYPTPDVAFFERADLNPNDAVAAAVLAGQVV